MADRGHLATERSNPRTRDLDQLDALAAVTLVQEEDAKLSVALADARPSIAAAIELIREKLATGGRLFYFGAGTSGRLGVLDAAECPPTFHSDPELVQGVIAGGHAALTHAVEGAEDSIEDAVIDVHARGVGPLDVAFGITAGGTTPYVHSALNAARAAGASTVFFACVPASEAPDSADVSIRVLTGPEALAGSTRMKAGTATKLVLNTITTLTMAGLGKIHGNLMVDVNTSANAKLVDRGERLVMEIAGVDRETASGLLEAAGGRVKTAVVMHAASCDPETAEARLAQANGVLRAALKL